MEQIESVYVHCGAHFSVPEKATPPLGWRCGPATETDGEVHLDCRLSGVSSIRKFLAI